MNALFSLLTLACLLFSNLYGDEESPSNKKRILVGSPIRQEPEILKEFLESLDQLEKNSYTLEFCFVDDNLHPASKYILSEFAKGHPGRCRLMHPESLADISSHYINEYTHYWTPEMIWKVAAFKDRIIDYAKEQHVDYLFLIDSDLVLHPKTLEQLLSAHKGIVCNIFWTSWQPGTIEMPQVWLQDEYNFYEVINNKKPPQEEIERKGREFMNLLRQPGTYEVGGLGACTLIDRETLMKGVSFRKIKNVSFWGEDRHFCIRAAALGIPLYVDTHYPAYHIYRMSALPGAAAYKEATRKAPPPRLTLSMIVKDEGKRHLRRVLESAKAYITDAVIIDDGSEDDSVEICREVLKGIPLKLVINDHSKFSQESSLREQQWNETAATRPDWILCLDADEIFEEKFQEAIKSMTADPLADAYFFRLYDFWSPTHYREDKYWSAHHYYRPFLVRYKPGMTYTFKQTAQHCGRFPVEVLAYPNARRSEMRLKHYGWSTEESRVEKYERYRRLDPEGKYGSKEQYESILDPNPHLVEWTE